MPPDRPDTAHPAVRSQSETRAEPGPEPPTTDGPAAPAAGPPGVDIPGYEILAELGRGGMGVIYQARHVRLNRTVALKVILAGGHSTPEGRARFLREAEAAAGLKHPNVVQVYEVGEHAGLPYFTLEFCEGGSLAARAKDPLPPREAAELVEQVARGVAAAHAAGVVHRDLKPENVLLSGGVPKVADFGLAKSAGSTEGLTATGAVLGTPGYMAPEQASGGGRRVGPAADVWALGALLYRLLTGRPPFQAPTAVDVLLQVSTADPVPPSVLVPKVPRDLETVCLACLRKDPAKRYPTAEAMADDLRRFLNGEPTVARPVGSAERAWKWVRRNRGVVAAAAAVFLALAAGAGAAAWEAVRATDAQREATRQLARTRQAEERVREERDNARAAEDRERAAAELARRREAEAKAAEAKALERQRQEEAARELADAEADRANQVSDFLVGLFRSSDPLDIFGKEVVPPSYEHLRRRTAKDLLDAAAKQFADDGLADQPLVRAKLLTTVGTSYRNLGEFAKAAPLLEESLKLRQRELPADHPAVLESESALGQLALDTGDFPAAEAHFARVLAAQEKAGAGPKVRSGTRWFLAWALGMQGRPEAERLFREESENRTKLYGPTHRETMYAKFGLVSVLLDQGRASEAAPVLAEILAALRQQPDGQVRAAAAVLSEFHAGCALMYASAEAGPLRELTLRRSEACFRSALAKARAAIPEVHIYVALIRFQLGDVLDRLGDDRAAEAEYRATLDVVRKTTGVAHPKVQVLTVAYAGLLARTGRLAEARALFEEVSAANRDQFGPDNHFRPVLLLSRANFELARGRDPDGAAPFVAEALAILRRRKPPPTRYLADALEAVANRFPLDRHAPLAGELYDEARRVAAAVYGEPSPEVCVLTCLRGWALYRGGERAAGERLIREAAAAEPALGGRLPAAERAWVLYARGKVAADRGRLADAEPDLRRAAELSRSAGATEDRQLIRLAFAGVLVERGKAGEAVPVLKDYRRAAAAGRKPAERALATADRLLCLARLAAGDPDGHRAAVREMAGRFGRSNDPHTVAALA